MGPDGKMHPYIAGFMGGLTRLPDDDPRALSDPNRPSDLPTGAPKVHPKGSSKVMPAPFSNPRNVFLDANGDMEVEDDPANPPSVSDSPGGSKDGTGMEVDSGPGGVALRAQNPSSTSGQNGTGETPVNLNTKWEMGILTQTRTARLPLTVFFSMNNLTKTGLPLRIRLNAPYNIFDENVLVAQTTGSAYATGLSNTLKIENSSSMPSSVPAASAFPVTVVGSSAAAGNVSSYGTIADTAAIPAWRKFYEKVWNSYHTIQTHYRIHVENTCNDVNSTFYLFTDMDSYTAASQIQKIPGANSIEHYMRWPKVKTTKIGPRYCQDGSGERKHWHTFEGTWRPGQIAKTTKNDEDIKAWYTTGAEPDPDWREEFVLIACLGDMGAKSNTEQGINIRVDLEYIVQFKDLKAPVLYPSPADTPVNTLIIPTDILQVPNVPETLPVS